jgi:hypothetical protein
VDVDVRFCGRARFTTGGSSDSQLPVPLSSTSSSTCLSFFLSFFLSNLNVYGGVTNSTGRTIRISISCSRFYGGAHRSAGLRRSQSSHKFACSQTQLDSFSWSSLYGGADVSAARFSALILFMLFPANPLRQVLVVYDKVLPI